MKKLKVYEVITEDWTTATKIYVPAESKKDAENFVAGNGEIVSCKESKNYGENTISLSKIQDALKVAHFGVTEIDIISRILYRTSDIFID